MLTELCLNSRHRCIQQTLDSFRILTKRDGERRVHFSVHAKKKKEKKRETIHFYIVLPHIFAILVSMSFPLPCHYEAFIQLPRACQRLAQPAMVLALWAASPFPSGRLASSTPQGNHAALCQFEPRPQNTRVGPPRLAGWRDCGDEAGERKGPEALWVGWHSPVFSPHSLCIAGAFVVETDSLIFQWCLNRFLLLIIFHCIRFCFVLSTGQMNKNSVN